MAETVQGMQGLLKKMEDLPYTLQKTAIARALRAGAEPIRARAEALAPSDPETSGDRIKDFMVTRVLDQTATGATAYIGTKPWTFIARFAEFGTAFESARPFMRPAYDEQKENALKLIGETLAEEIEKAMKKL